MADQIPRSVMITLARRQRRTSVNAETIVWKALRDRRCGNFKFRRQVPIGSYIVDFVCFDKKLVIEIDGPSHRTDEQQLRDVGRDRWFQTQGFQILRLSNDLVIGSPDLAIRRINELLES